MTLKCHEIEFLQHQKQNKWCNHQVLSTQIKFRHFFYSFLLNKEDIWWNNELKHTDAIQFLFSLHYFVPGPVQYVAQVERRTWLLCETPGGKTKQKKRILWLTINWQRVNRLNNNNNVCAYKIMEGLFHRKPLTFCSPLLDAASNQSQGAGLYSGG